eukprot:11062027-Ditylum_brightwellii.AAC.1
MKNGILPAQCLVARQSCVTIVTGTQIISLKKSSISNKLRQLQTIYYTLQEYHNNCGRTKWIGRKNETSNKQ